MKANRNHSIIRILFCAVLAFVALVIWPMGSSTVLADGTIPQWPEEAPDTVTPEEGGSSSSQIDYIVTTVETLALVL